MNPVPPPMGASKFSWTPQKAKKEQLSGGAFSLWCIIEEIFLIGRCTREIGGGAG